MISLKHLPFCWISTRGLFLLIGLAYHLHSLLLCIFVVLSLFVLLLLLALHLVAKDLIFQQISLRDRLFMLLFSLLVFPLFL